MTADPGAAGAGLAGPPESGPARAARSLSLRTRLTVWVALVVALGIAVSGWIAVDGAERELRGEVDTFLQDRVVRLGGAPILQAFEGRRGPARGRFGFDRFSEDDAVTQLVDAEGQILGLGEVELPVSAADLEAAAGLQRAPSLRTVSVDGTEYRVITAHLGRGVAVMVGRDLSEIDSALGGIARRTVVLGAAGAAVAALIAWVLATRLTRPIGRLTLAAENVAATQELAASIDVHGRDEVGRLAASFNTMLEALDTSRRQQQRLVMDASHELRTPLTSLRTNVDLLRRAGTLGEDTTAEVLTDISGELDELTALVAELVELATTTRRAQEPTTTVALDEIAEAVAERARRRSGRAVRVTSVDVEPVEGHPALIERAVSNLVDNALKFSPAETEVEVAVTAGRVAVRDHGPGIHPDDRPHVFDRFYRAVATRGAPGSGLGLAIVRDIVQAHHGTVFITEPSDGEGTVVGFSLPTEPVTMR